MKISTLRLLFTAAVTACALATQAQAAVVYSLASDGTSLIRFNSATPGTVTSVGPIAGATTRLDGLDFRPADGLLYGYNNTTDSIYNVDFNSGSVSLLTGITNPTNTNSLGIDFNPLADRLRIVTISDQNLRVNLAGGGAIVDGTLAYAVGDPNFGVDPNIVDAAYTNSSLGAPASTSLFYIDYLTNTLVAGSNPNAGTLTTVGSLGIDIDARAGFDIYTDAGINSAYGAFSVGGVNGFYSVNLATGAATLQGAIGDTSLLYGLAIVPGSTAVPEPGPLALLGAALLCALGMRRWRVTMDSAG